MLMPMEACEFTTRAETAYDKAVDPRMKQPHKIAVMPDTNAGKCCD